MTIFWWWWHQGERSMILQKNAFYALYFATNGWVMGCVWLNVFPLLNQTLKRLTQVSVSVSYWEKVQIMACNATPRSLPSSYVKSCQLSSESDGYVSISYPRHKRTKNQRIRIRNQFVFGCMFHFWIDKWFSIINIEYRNSSLAKQMSCFYVSGVNITVAICKLVCV